MSTRWQELFADLEAQARSIDMGELAAEVADRTRGEASRIGMVSRLRRRIGHPVNLQVTGVGSVTGRLNGMGADWMLVSAGDDVVVVTEAVAAVVNLPPEAEAESAQVRLASRVPLTMVLRAMARDRSVVQVALRDGGTVTGTPDRIGRDFLDVAVHPSDLAPRLGQVRSRWTVATAAIAAVSRR